MLNSLYVFTVFRSPSNIHFKHQAFHFCDKLFQNVSPVLTSLLWDVQQRRKGEYPGNGYFLLQYCEKKSMRFQTAAILCTKRPKTFVLLFTLLQLFVNCLCFDFCLLTVLTSLLCLSSGPQHQYTQGFLHYSPSACSSVSFILQYCKYTDMLLVTYTHEPQLFSFSSSTTPCY